MTSPEVHVLPTALVVKVSIRNGVRLVVIVCPYCQRRHTHGWPLEAPDVGVRVSHCHRPSGEPVRSYVVHVAAVAGVR